MRKGTAILLIIATALTLIGGAIFVIGVLTTPTMDNNKYQSKTYESAEEVKEISITGDIANIKILPYDKEGYLVKCFEERKAYHSVNVKNGVLCIELEDTRKWYDLISLFSKPTYVTVYVPAGEYDSLTVKVDTADVFVEQDFTFDKADVSCSTGDVNFLASTKEALNIKVSRFTVSAFLRTLVPSAVFIRPVLRMPSKPL